jgi:hypothetical protein
MTSHSSQGQTAERVLIHVDTEAGSQLVNSRMAYVAISRGRYDSQIYTDSKADLADQLSREHSHSAAISSHRHNGHSAEANDRVGCAQNDIAQGQSGTAHSPAQAQGIGQGESVGT